MVRTHQLHGMPSAGLKAAWNRVGMPCCNPTAQERNQAATLRQAYPGAQAVAAGPPASCRRAASRRASAGSAALLLLRRDAPRAVAALQHLSHAPRPAAQAPMPRSRCRLHQLCRQSRQVVKHTCSAAASLLTVTEEEAAVVDASASAVRALQSRHDRETHDQVAKCREGGVGGC